LGGRGPRWRRWFGGVRRPGNPLPSAPGSSQHPAARRRRYAHLLGPLGGPPAAAEKMAGWPRAAKNRRGAAAAALAGSQGRVTGPVPSGGLARGRGRLSAPSPRAGVMGPRLQEGAPKRLRLRGRLHSARMALGPAAALLKSDRRVTLEGGALLGSVLAPVPRPGNHPRRCARLGCGRDLARCDPRVIPRPAASRSSRSTLAGAAATGVDGALCCREVHASRRHGLHPSHSYSDKRNDWLRGDRIVRVV